ncbi:hypothetical protein [Chengkuizengella marina]|nr:hypothetical protein [Chengkuizengella marina]
MNHVLALQQLEVREDSKQYKPETVTDGLLEGINGYKFCHKKVTDKN